MSRNKRRDNVALDIYGRRGLQLNSSAANDEETLYSMYERVIGELAMNRFKWSGFPPSVNVRFLEMTLHLHGLIVVFEDTGSRKRPGTNHIFALRGTPSGQMNMVGDPISYTLTGPGMDQHFQGVQLAINKCVPIWPNYFRRTDWDIISTYSRKLAKIDRTIEINLESARRNKVLVYDENTRLSAENINRMIDRGEGTIRVKYDLGQMIQALDLGVDPKHIETLSVVRGRLWSEAMGLLGINNANQDKKERLVESEVDANDDQVNNMRFVNLNAREYACEQMARMFPDKLANVKVEYRSDALQREMESMLGFESERETNGNVHDGTVAADRASAG